MIYIGSSDGGPNMEESENRSLKRLTGNGLTVVSEDRRASGPLQLPKKPADVDIIGRHHVLPSNPDAVTYDPADPQEQISLRYTGIRASDGNSDPVTLTLPIRVIDTVVGHM